MPSPVSPLHVATAGGFAPLPVHFDRSASGAIREILLEAQHLFIETDPQQARFILFGSDDHAYIDESDLYRKFRRKCMCMSETDIPTYRLPGIYAANAKSLLTASRIKTSNYFISERINPNPEIGKIEPARFAKKYLYSFMGGSNCWPRKHLFRLIKCREDTHIEATDGYNHWTEQADRIAHRQAQRQRYAEIMAASKFALCPRGCGLSSYRLFESMSLGIAPVIISDRWRPIDGIDWSFAMFVRERDIRRLDTIMRSHESEWAARGARAREVYWNKLAGPHVYDLIFRHLIYLEQHYSPAREAILRHVTAWNTKKTRIEWAAYDQIKYLTLRFFNLTGMPMPITLHQPVEEQIARRDRVNL